MTSELSAWVMGVYAFIVMLFLFGLEGWVTMVMVLIVVGAVFVFAWLFVLSGFLVAEMWIELENKREAAKILRKKNNA